MSDDLVRKQDIEDYINENIKSTNPDHYHNHKKFIEFMDSPEISDFGNWQWANGWNTALTAIMCALDRIAIKPMKPNTTIDRTWGIKSEQPVCPNCDYYLGNIHFSGDGKRKVTYCEHCGQAIDWSEYDGI